MSNRPGIKDIAKKAGVSIGTVDRVLHDRGEVKKETREKVLAIIQKLGYTPNVIAKSLRGNHQKKIAIILPASDEKNPYWDIQFTGIKAALDEIEIFNISTKVYKYSASNVQQFKTVLDKCLNEKLDGVVLNPSFKNESLEFITKLDQKKIPYVIFELNIENVNNIAFFGQDSYKSGQTSARVMDLSMSNTAHVAIIKMSDHKVFSHHIEKRVKGFRDYFTENVAKDINIYEYEIDLAEENQPTKQLDCLFKEKKLDGIFVPNTRGFILSKYMESRNIKNQIVIGFDLVEENVEHLKKGNITVLIDQKPQDQAYNAVMTLYNKIIHNKSGAKDNYSPINIIMKENLHYY